MPETRSSINTLLVKRFQIPAILERLVTILLLVDNLSSPTLEAPRSISNIILEVLLYCYIIAMPRIENLGRHRQ
jgi:hypothetical protein